MEIKEVVLVFFMDGLVPKCKVKFVSVEGEEKDTIVPITTDIIRFMLERGDDMPCA